MNSYHDFELFSPGMTTNTYTVNEQNHWVIQGISAAEPVFEDNFDADIAAISEESTADFWNDSGYHSGSTESFEASSDDITQHHDRQNTTTFPTTPVLPKTIHPGAPAASSKSNHASTRRGNLNKSTSHLSRGNQAHKKAKETRLTKTVHHSIHEHEHKTPHMYTTENADEFGLEQWATTQERHERIACGVFNRRQQRDSSSGNRRKTGSKK